MGETPAPPLRWWQRAVPVSLLVGAVAAVALVAGVPGRQLELSTTRVPQPFLEAQLVGRGAAACVGPGERAWVRAKVTSRLEDTEHLQWTVRLERDRADETEAATRRKQGRFRLDPDATRVLRTSLRAPRRPYTVTVRFPDHPEVLRAHCRARPR